MTKLIIKSSAVNATCDQNAAFVGLEGMNARVLLLGTNQVVTVSFSAIVGIIFIDGNTEHTKFVGPSDRIPKFAIKPVTVGVGESEVTVSSLSDEVAKIQFTQGDPVYVHNNVIEALRRVQRL